MNKVKFLMLSMSAIAVLAGCSKNDDAIPDRPKGQEAKVILKLAGMVGQEGAVSKATGGPTDLNDLNTSNGTVNNLTVFIFNEGGDVISKTYFSPASALDAGITTTTDAFEVAVVTNTGDLTGAGGLFNAVSTKAQLREVLTNLLPNNPTIASVATQQDNNLYMSGMVKLSKFATAPDSNTQVATANVNLSYISARILLTKISYNGGDTKTNVYAPAATFDNNEEANFTIPRIYLMNVQRASRFFYKGEQLEDQQYIFQAEKQFAGGVSWADPWTGDAPKGFVVNNEYILKNTDLPAAAGNALTSIGHWYTFANPDVENILNHPTAIVIEVKFRDRKADSGAQPPVTHAFGTRYFTIYFGGGDQQMLVAGKTYDVSVNLKGSFLPGGGGGGGSTTPGKPTITGAKVTVTITSAVWANPIKIIKDFT